MQPVQQFAFEKNAVRVVMREQDPWFVGIDVCRALALKNNNQVLGRLDEDEREVANGDTFGGKQKLVIVSEPGLYRLIFTSRSTLAERFKRWLAHDVLPELRKTGVFDAKGVHSVDPLQSPSPADAEPRSWPVIQKLQAVQLCARIHGRLRAEAMWRAVGLPPVPPPPVTAVDEARICLRHLLDSPAYDAGPAIRDLIEAALDEDENARAHLLPCGVRVYPDRDCFLVANGTPGLAAIFAGTDWTAGRYVRVLRRLPGVATSGTARFGGVNRRGSLVPSSYLDEDAGALVAA